MRDKSNERIIEEILYVTNSLGFGTVTVYDDLFAARRSKFLNLVDDMKKVGDILGNTKFLLPNALSVSVMTEDIIDAIEEMGVEYFRVAIESGSQYTQDNIILKRVNLQKCRKILKYMRKKKMPIESNFILGYPNETKELMKETIDFINSIDIDWVLIFSALPLPGTTLFQEFIDMGVIDEEK